MKYLTTINQLLILGLLLSACSGAMGTKNDLANDSLVSNGLSRSIADSNVVTAQTVSSPQLTATAATVIAPAIKYGYTGKRLDSESEQNDYDARSYASRQMHFTTPDSIVPNPMEPQSFNRYAYVNNNPMKYVDPTGHDPVPWKTICPGGKCGSEFGQYLTRKWDEFTSRFAPEAKGLLSEYIRGGNLISASTDVVEDALAGQAAFGIHTRLADGTSFIGIAVNNIATDGELVSTMMHELAHFQGGDEFHAYSAEVDFLERGIKAGALDVGKEFVAHAALGIAEHHEARSKLIKAFEALGGEKEAASIFKARFNRTIDAAKFVGNWAYRGGAKALVGFGLGVAAANFADAHERGDNIGMISAGANALDAASPVPTGISDIWNIGIAWGNHVWQSYAPVQLQIEEMR